MKEPYEVFLDEALAAAEKGSDEHLNDAIQVTADYLYNIVGYSERDALSVVGLFKKTFNRALEEGSDLRLALREAQHRWEHPER